MEPVFRFRILRQAKLGTRSIPANPESRIKARLIIPGLTSGEAPVLAVPGGSDRPAARLRKAKEGRPERAMPNPHLVSGQMDRPGPSVDFGRVMVPTHGASGPAPEGGSPGSARCKSGRSVGRVYESALI